MKLDGDVVDCSVIIEGLAGIAAVVLGTVAVAAVVVVELVVGDTSDSFQASGSCSACSDWLEYCLHNHLHERCLAWKAPSFDVVADSTSSCVGIDFHA